MKKLLIVGMLLLCGCGKQLKKEYIRGCADSAGEIIAQLTGQELPRKLLEDTCEKEYDLHK